ncbi:MAG: hypothetical protein ACJAWW_002651 [Sulfurimonas sp.]
MNKKLVKVPGTTLPFYMYEEDGLTIYEFNATECSPPEPMVNTIKGINLLKSEYDRLIGIFYHEPFPLYDRLPFSILHEAEELESGDFKITFKKDI